MRMPRNRQTPQKLLSYLEDYQRTSVLVDTLGSAAPAKTKAHLQHLETLLAAAEAALELVTPANDN
jgi:hypothetical protein